DFYNRVGTRIELQSATLSRKGSDLHVCLTLANTGYGRVIRARPATLIFLSQAAVVAQVAVPLAELDLRTLVEEPRSFDFDVTLPTLPADVSVALSIPDPAPSLTGQAVYALPLNSVAANGTPVFD